MTDLDKLKACFDDIGVDYIYEFMQTKTESYLIVNAGEDRHEQYFMFNCDGEFFNSI